MLGLLVEETGVSALSILTLFQLSFGSLTTTAFFVGFSFIASGLAGFLLLGLGSNTYFCFGDATGDIHLNRRHTDFFACFGERMKMEDGGRFQPPPPPPPTTPARLGGIDYSTLLIIQRLFGWGQGHPASKTKTPLFKRGRTDEEEQFKRNPFSICRSSLKRPHTAPTILPASADGDAKAYQETRKKQERGLTYSSVFTLRNAFNFKSKTLSKYQLLPTARRRGLLRW